MKFSRSRRPGCRVEKLERRRLMAGDLEPFLNEAISNVAAQESVVEADIAESISSADFARLDGNEDGQVTAVDALMVINAINQVALLETDRLAEEVDSSIDYNSDGFVTAADALMVINHLNLQDAATVELFFSETVVEIGWHGGCSCGGVGCAACTVASTDDSL